MKWHFIVPLLGLFASACDDAQPFKSSNIQELQALGKDEILQFRYHTGLRVKNRLVSITIHRDRAMRIVTESAGEEKQANDKKLTTEELRILEAKISAVDWKKVAKDDVLGLDGETIFFQTPHAAVALWTPDYKIRERKLENFNDLIGQLFSLAGLTQQGLPAQSEQGGGGHSAAPRASP